MTSPTEPSQRTFAVPIWVITAAATVAGLLLGLALALLAGSEDRVDADPAGLSSTAPGTVDPTASEVPSPSDSATPTPSPSDSPSPTELRTLGIYYLAEQDDGGHRLYREFRKVTVADARPVAAAVNAMFQLPPLDRDYMSPWPADSRVVATEKSGDVVAIQLNAGAIGGPDQDAELATMAIQQLVHTATAADPTVREVQILVDGDPLVKLWGQPVGAQPISRAAASTALGPVWIIEPAEGDTVGRTFTATGTAEVFEATVSYEVLRPDGGLVADGSIIANTAESSRGQWSTQLTLEPGTYVLRFFYHSADDGTPRGIDTKTINVR